MLKKKCKNCIEYRNCKDSFTSWIFFVLGMIATIAIRAVAILGNFKKLYADIAWYIGVVGFLLFFLYKFRIENRRKKLINKKNLLNKIMEANCLSLEEKDILTSILCSLSSNKDKINYFLIFISSAIALVFAIYLDFIK